MRALIALRTPYTRATRIAAGIGQVFAFLFGFLGLFGNPMLIFIALFLYLGASQEAAVASLKDVSEWLSVSDAMVTDFSVLSSESTVADAIRALLRTSQHEFPVVDGAGAGARHADARRHDTRATDSRTGYPGRGRHAGTMFRSLRRTPASKMRSKPCRNRTARHFRSSIPGGGWWAFLP